MTREAVSLPLALTRELKAWPVDVQIIMQANLIQQLEGYNNASKVIVVDRPDEWEIRRLIEEGDDTRLKRNFLTNWYQRGNKYVAMVSDTVLLHEYCVTYGTQYYYLVCGYDDLYDALYVLKGSAFYT